MRLVAGVRAGQARNSGIPLPEEEASLVENDGPFFKIGVYFYCPRDLSGRMYERGPRARNIRKNARDAALFGAHAYDFDMRAAPMYRPGYPRRVFCDIWAPRNT